MDEKQFEQDYRNWKRQAAPDLWDRIDGKLRDYPEREFKATVNTSKISDVVDYLPGENQMHNLHSEKQIYHPFGENRNYNSTDEKQIYHLSGENQNFNQRSKKRMDNLPGKKRLYQLAASFAAVFCFAAAVPGLYHKFSVLSGSGAGQQEATSAVQFQETMIAEQTNPAENEGNLAAGQRNPAEVEGNPAAASPTNSPESITENSTNGNVVQTKTRLIVPENAIVLSSDSAYFSQAILADTELLITATVENASLEYDSQGRAERAAYQLSLSRIHFSQDYLNQTDRITVKSPIVKAEGDEAWLLYQMELGSTYLLPLKKQEGNWELLYPFAPQIQQTDTKGWIFHSGYSCLINEGTQVVEGKKEGENDYFYDRMLLREDDRFLSDLLELIQQP